MAFVVALVFLVVISIVFHFLSPWWLTPIASEWTTIDTTIDITFWVTGFVFISVNLFTAWAVYKYRFKPDRRAHYEPENKKLEVWLTALTSVGVIAMLAPGLFVWANFVEVPEDADEFEAVGAQWQWNYRYPGADGIMGTADAIYVNPTNPLGVNPNDPNGQDDKIIESGHTYLPINRPVRAWLRSKDVLHDFAVAEFRVKMDLVPGLVSYLWFTPNKEGTYDVLCEELCGIGHHIMRGKVTVTTEDKFKAWLDDQPTFAETQARGTGDAEAGKASYAVCSGCHGPQGEGNLQLNAPKLAGLQGWYLKRQLQYYKSGARGSEPGDSFGQMMGPMASTLATDDMVNNVAAYIETLPDTPAAETVTGNLKKGKKYYEATCGICHGPKGEGVWSVNAPALAGMSDWYLVTQLKHYKSGARGKNNGDFFGYQMVSMVSALGDDQAINDVVAYINTLK